MKNFQQLSRFKINTFRKSMDDVISSGGRWTFPREQKTIYDKSYCNYDTFWFFQDTTLNCKDFVSWWRSKMINYPVLRKDAKYITTKKEPLKRDYEYYEEWRSSSVLWRLVIKNGSRYTTFTIGARPGGGEYNMVLLSRTRFEDE